MDLKFSQITKYPPLNAVIILKGHFASDRWLRKINFLSTKIKDGAANWYRDASKIEKSMLRIQLSPILILEGNNIIIRELLENRTSSRQSSFDIVVRTDPIHLFNNDEDVATTVL